MYTAEMTNSNILDKYTQLFIDHGMSEDSYYAIVGLLTEFTMEFITEWEKNKPKDETVQPGPEWVNSSTHVESDTQYNKNYKITWQKELNEPRGYPTGVTRNWTCECGDYVYRGLGQNKPDYECKHIATAKGRWS